VPQTLLVVEALDRPPLAEPEAPEEVGRRVLAPRQPGQGYGQVAAPLAHPLETGLGEEATHATTAEDTLDGHRFVGADPACEELDRFRTEALVVGAVLRDQEACHCGPHRLRASFSGDPDRCGRIGCVPFEPSTLVDVSTQLPIEERLRRHRMRAINRLWPDD